MATSNDDFLGYLNTTWLEKKDQLVDKYFVVYFLL